MKKFLFFSLCLLMVFNASFSEDLPEIYEEKPVQEVIESETLDNKFIIESVYNPVFDEIRIYIYTNVKIDADDGVLDSYYQYYMYQWVRNEKHRYYNYKTISRTHFYKKFYKGEYRNIYEIHAILKK